MNAVEVDVQGPAQSGWDPLSPAALRVEILAAFVAIIIVTKLGLLPAAAIGELGRLASLLLP